MAIGAYPFGLVLGFLILSVGHVLQKVLPSGPSGSPEITILDKVVNWTNIAACQSGPSEIVPCICVFTVIPLPGREDHRSARGGL